MIIDAGDHVVLVSGRYAIEAGGDESAVVAPDGGRLVVVDLYVDDEAQEE